MRRVPRPTALVVQAVLGLRRRPEHRSELLNQLLLGEGVRVLARRQGWCRVESLDDGYSGWAKDWGLKGVSAAGFARWRRQAGHRVVALMSRLRGSMGGGEVIGPVSYGARLSVLSRRGRFARVQLPDEREAWIHAADLTPAGRPALSIEDRLEQLSGAPYLWGGRTPLGLDCSGLTQLVLAEHGIPLPRDAHEQFAACLPLAASQTLRVGDLAFFSVAPRARMGHVAIYLGDGFYGHARGMVRRNSFDPSSALFDKDLSAQLRAFGRPRRRTPSRPGRKR